MDIPKLLYHGTFWVDGIEPEDRLYQLDCYISTSENYGWARFFARVKRHENKEKAGNMVIYTIDTKKLPEDVIKNALPPDGLHPMAKDDDEMRRIEEEMKPDRIKTKDWRLPYVPFDAVVKKEEYPREPEPDMLEPLWPL